MSAAETIATVLAAHWEHHTESGSDNWICVCGVELGPGEPDALLRAHVAAAIAEALGSSDDGLRSSLVAPLREFIVQEVGFDAGPLMDKQAELGAAQIAAAINRPTS